MGEIADMMLDGTLCEGCGVYMGSSGHGYPRRCGACARDEARARDMEVPPNESRNVSCPKCGKRVRRAGLEMHTRAVHGDAS